jgi:L-ribulose-5-phosphate 3-epimerase
MRTTPGVKHVAMITRRTFLAGAAAAALLSRPLFAQTAPTTRPQRYKISAADWMMLKRQTPGALDRAHDAGLDGVEIDMGPLGKRPDFENKLVDATFLHDYLDKARGYNLEISSLAMSAFYGQSFGKHPKADQFLATWIELMPKLGTKVGFLPIIKFDNDEMRTMTVAHLKTAAPAAEKAGVILGLSTPLTVDEDKKLLDDIGSPAVRIAYNVGEATDAGRDVYAELKSLGKDRISEVIPTLSDGVLLQDDKRLDVPRLKGVLDAMGWSGWLVLQRSRDAKRARDVKYNFGSNGAYLKSIFQA